MYRLDGFDLVPLLRPPDLLEATMKTASPTIANTLAAHGIRHVFRHGRRRDVTSTTRSAGRKSPATSLSPSRAGVRDRGRGLRGTAARWRR